MARQRLSVVGRHRAYKPESVSAGVPQIQEDGGKRVWRATLLAGSLQRTQQSRRVCPGDADLMRQAFVVPHAGSRRNGNHGGVESR